MAHTFNIQTIKDSRGSLSVLEKLPFEIKRVYFLHSIDKSASRGGHAHKQLQRIMVAVNGSFTVSVRGKSEREYVLNSPTEGLLIQPMEWLELSNFSDDAVCLVLASLEHDEKDCIRDFNVFAQEVK